MNMRSRLRKIAMSLTPEQGALKLVASIRQYQSLDDYCASRLERWGTAPLEELCEQLKESVECAMPDAEAKPVDRAIRVATRNAVFLSFLHHHVTALVTQEERILGLMFLLLDEKLGRIILSPEKVIPGSHDESILKNRGQEFVETAEGLAQHLYGILTAIKFIEDTYFKGTNLLFDSSRLSLNAVTEQLEKAAAVYNELVVGRCTWTGRIVDLENVRSASTQRAERFSADLVDMAKADTSMYMSDGQGARKIMRRLAERAAGSCPRKGGTSRPATVNRSSGSGQSAEGFPAEPCAPQTFS